MLIELYLLQTYFEEPSAFMYEDDLVARFGWPAFRAALEDGLIERRRIPCGHGRVRNLCRLSQSGEAMACATMDGAQKTALYLKANS